MSHGQATRQIDLSQIQIPKCHGFRRAGLALMVIGLVAYAAAMGMGLTSDHAAEFHFSYLTAYMYWLSIALGMLLFTLVQHAVRAGWSPAVRRIAEAFISTMPLLGLMALPIVFLGAHDLFEWTHLNAETGMLSHADGTTTYDPVLKHKAPYLNEAFFQKRAIFYILVWSVLGLYFWKTSVKQDESGDHALSHSLRRWAPLGIVLYALTSTAAAFDWMMSLQPHWYSTIFGVYYFAGSFIGCFATLIVVSMLLQRVGFMTQIVTTEHYHDLGKFMKAFVIFWAYIAFSQYFLIWYANIPEETIFYATRWEGSWKYVSLFLLFGHFLFPLLFLLSRHIKRYPKTLLFGACWMLVARYVDIYWNTQPMLGHHTGHHDPIFGVYHLLCFIGIGGLMVGLALTVLSRHALIPKGDPRISESLAFENF